ncbi:RadC family protein [Chitinophagaceae bacterium MMS25-I14]
MIKEQEFVPGSIKNWAESEKPREKLLNKGSSSLSDAELLAILINSGTTRKSAVDLARETLALAENNLQQLGRLTVDELKQIHGIGEARAITIAAALELGRRRQINEALQRTAVISSKEAAKIFIPIMCDLSHEVFGILYLNQASRLLRHEIISIGGLTATVADVRLMLKNALLQNANQIIIAHNHPSGNLKPSNADKSLTNKLYDAAALMDIRLVDHIIVANNSYLSMRDEGMM